MIKAVFFDFYNTLIDFEPSREELEARALAELGVTVSPEALRRPLFAADEFIYAENARIPFNQRSKAEVRAVYARYQEIILGEAGVACSPELIAALLGKWRDLQYKLVLFDDVMPALTHLGGLGLVLGLISNVDHDIAPTCQELGLSPKFQVMVTSLEVGFNKPQPEIFLAALEQAGVSPQESIYVGDQHQIDVVGAEGAGMYGILLDRYGCYDPALTAPRISRLTEVTRYL